MVPEALEGTTRTSNTTSQMTKNSNHITFNSNGKLLLTGEYVVLDGALSLAIPTTYGQSLKIEPINESKLIWKSLDEKGSVWFEDTFEIIYNEISLSVRNDSTISERLLQILNAAKQLNPDFLNAKQGFSITTKLDFPRQWGLGTSSTLINNLAQWAQVDAYQLLEKTFGGSGYDIACAQHHTPITYQLCNADEIQSQPFDCAQGETIKHDKKRNINEVNFNPSFKNHLYFVYLNEKQNSRDGIAQFKKNRSDLSDSISEINNITQNIMSCKTIENFIMLIEEHENIISKIIKQNPVKARLFSDFNGGIKSLGAWGGDFILVAAHNNPTDYFSEKGFKTIIPFKDMIR
ncbi:GYDIA family GHMP kinase [Hwangdonia lutea]|uniref:GYDIA family GHMP kinase n=1 Tax=Hwangdonia lutea TaxID=3075823 RepID=A0AA97HRA1_9FLAO|nr:GYDIA family GHMP kinase [Hwangdonia sp. SCSIO 19198]WOD44387.1 GYDIA family GHMP kinase [Hwangdonia sp. SCSIO 19198]